MSSCFNSAHTASSADLFFMLWKFTTITLILWGDVTWLLLSLFLPDLLGEEEEVASGDLKESSESTEPILVEVVVLELESDNLISLLNSEEAKFGMPHWQQYHDSLLSILLYTAKLLM